jgi:tetratricopeptide (TPR) repeat protein
MDLMAGLPQVTGDTTKVALRNTGTFDATVNVSARTADGEVVAAPATVRAGSFGEINFKPRAKIVRVEIDSEKLYPQTDYSNDIAPRESAESDVLLNVKRAFDKQDFAGAEKVARQVLSNWPRYDDVRVLLARSLAALGRSAEAEKEFRAVLAEKLPTARSIAWADLGIGELAQKAGQTAQALAAAQDAIRADGEYGATLGAFNLREKLNIAQSGDDDIKAFFAQFDKAVTANRKADIDSMITPGDAVKFANGLAGQTEQWQSQVRQIDKLDENTALVDTQLSIKLLNRDPVSGLAVFRLSRVGGVWKLSGVEIFEVR